MKPEHPHVHAGLNTPVPSSKGPLRVLIVEDYEDDAALILRQIGKGGYQVTADRVETPAAMEAALDQRSWDVVISDWALPHFSAPDALELVKRKETDLPFIIVSGTIGEDIAVAAMRAGAHDFLAKDRLARLVPAVDRELREAHIRRERKEMQAQLLVSDRLATVGILAAGVAHEINNPLATLLANLDLVERELGALRPPPGEGLREAREELADIRESAERIRSIVRDLKIFSRAETEQRAAVDVHKLLDSSLRMAWTEIRHRARLHKRYLPVPPVDANESRLGQVFLNLLVNAAQSIPEGRAEKNQISVGTELASDGRVVIEVRDSGSGIPQDLLKRLFTPFVTTKPAGEGTGLGLSICRRIVTSFGGEITVESEVGRGSVFRVHLLPAQAPVPEATSAAAMAPAARRRGSVLVIDDEPTIGTAIRRLLKYDHDVITTGSAHDALSDIAAGAHYDVILCDLMMPHLTGMDFYAELSRLAPDQADRIVFLTGGAFTPSALEFLDQVGNLRIEKPFDVTALRAIVNERVR